MPFGRLGQLAVLLTVSYWTGRSIALRVKQLTETVPDILARIVARKREELAERRGRVLRQPSRKDAEAHLDHQRGFRFGSLRSHSPAIIAEIKKASPSKGLLSHDFQPRPNRAQPISRAAPPPSRSSPTAISSRAVFTISPQMRSRRRRVCPCSARTSPSLAVACGGSRSPWGRRHPSDRCHPYRQGDA